MSLNHKEFEKRWEQAHRQQRPQKKKASIAPVHIQ